MLQRTERHIFTNRQDLEQLCYKVKLLYNFCNYHIRHAYFGEIEKFSEYELTGLLAEFNQEDYRRLPAQTSQQIIKLLFNNWKLFWKANKEYKKQPSKFKGKPKPPKYKKSQSIVIFTSPKQIKIREGFICFPKMVKLEPIKTNVSNIKQVRIIILNYISSYIAILKSYQI